VAAPFAEDIASPVDQPKPETARAPIDRDVCSLAHFKSVPMLSAPWDNGITPICRRATPAFHLIYRDATSMI
jgi:hypothetical protein